MKRCPQKQLMSLYKVPEFKDSEDFLQNVAFQRGRLLPGGIGDSSSAARVVLHDWHNGKIPYYTLPPERDMNAFQEAEIVDSWREDFNADKVGIFQICKRQYSYFFFWPQLTVVSFMLK